MEIKLVLFMLLGFSSYWLVKVLAAILGDAPVINCKDFLKLYYKEFIASVVAFILIAEGGRDLPDAIGKITNPLAAFAIGGSLPSIAMNVFGLAFSFLKK